MEHEDAFRAVKLPFPPQEYLCTWKLPDIRLKNNEDRQGEGSDGGVVEANGVLDLTAGRHPHGSFYGKLPILWEGDSGEFPQINDFDCLIGRLSSGAYFALMNGQYSYWMPGHGYVNGAFATLSRKPFKRNEYRTYRSIELQLEGLDEIIDVNPAEIEVTSGEKSIFSVTGNDECWEWESGGTSMKLCFAGRTQPDPFNFSMRLAPVLRIDIGIPLNMVDWWQCWIVPLQELIAAVIGRTPDVMYVLAIAGRTPKRKREWKDQIFSWDIKQECLYPDVDKLKKSKPAIRIQEDKVNLLSLLMRWQGLQSSHHPLVETFESMALSSEQHPRSRFLLLIQALEGLYGFEHQEEQYERRQAYKNERREFLDRMNKIIAEDDRQFLSENLLRNPYVSLESALIAIFNGFSASVREEIDAAPLVKKVREAEANQHMRVEAVLAKVRNKLSHGATNYEPDDLDGVAAILDRVVRSELLRVLEAPESCRKRLLSNREK